MLYFRDRLRDAARHVLDGTPLGGRLPEVGNVTDDGTLLGIDAPDDVFYDGSLSTGEMQLLLLLESLAGRSMVELNLYALLTTLDDDCRRVVVEAVAIAAGVDELVVQP